MLAEKQVFQKIAKIGQILPSTGTAQIPWIYGHDDCSALHPVREHFLIDLFDLTIFGVFSMIFSS
jgi:hypothetical protein